LLGNSSVQPQKRWDDKKLFYFFGVPYAAGGRARDQTVVIQNVPSANSTHGALALTRAAEKGSGVRLTMAPFTRHLMAQQASRPWSN